MDTRAILRTDMGFYTGLYLGPSRLIPEKKHEPGS